MPFDPLTIAWDHVYWTEGPRFVALALADAALMSTWPEELATGSAGSGPYGVQSASKFWVKADAITGKVDGDAISTWADQSGSALDATQATGTKQPIYKTGILNGNPVVRFDGTDDVMATTAPATTVTDNWTMVLVVDPNTNAVDGVAPLCNGNDGTSAGYALATRTNTGKKGWLRCGLAWESSAVAADTNAGVWILQRKNGTTRLYVDGGAALFSTGNAPNAPTTKLQLGSHSLTTFLNGDMAEALVFDVALSLSDLNRMGAALATKWGTSWTTLVPANDMGQGTGFRQPTYDAALAKWNGHPSVRASDGNRYMLVDLDAAIAQPWEMVIIGSLGAGLTGTIYEQNIGELRGNGTNWTLQLPTSLSSAVAADTNDHMLRVVADATDTLYVDEVSVISGDCGANPMNRAMVLNDRFATDGASGASLVFIGVKSGSLSAGDRSNLFSWYQSTYLPPKSLPPTPRNRRADMRHLVTR